MPEYRRSARKHAGLNPHKFCQSLPPLATTPGNAPSSAQRRRRLRDLGHPPRERKSKYGSRICEGHGGADSAKRVFLREAPLPVCVSIMRE